MSHFLAGRLRVLRLERFALAHAVIGATGFTVGLLADQLELAMAVTLTAGLALHAVSQAAQRRRTESVEQRYRQLVEDMPLSFYITASDSNVDPVYVSNAIVDLLGYSLAEWKADPALFESIL